MEIKINNKDNIKNATTVARAISKSMGRSSLTRMAQDSIFQFPLLISSGIEADDIMTISSAIEKQYASLLTSALSLRGNVPVKKYENIQSYLQTFHSNKDIPSNIKAATNIAFESASFSDKVIPNLGDACWDIPDDQITLENLNDTYRPYVRTKRVLEEKLRVAKESLIDEQELKDAATRIEREESNSASTGISPKARSGVKHPAIVRNDKITSLEPTLINVEFVFHGNNDSWKQNVVIGVKNMVRIIRSDIMVSNMAEASKESYGIFKFIKWTKGEFKIIKDFIFNSSEMKDMATTSSKDSGRWWKALKRRRAINNITKFFDNKVLPNTTIIITSYEAEQIAGLTGVNLAETHNALNLINKSYLLGFGIVDTSSKSLSMLFDGDSDFANMSMNALRSNNGKDVNLNNMKDVMKLMGRI